VLRLYNMGGRSCQAVYHFLDLAAQTPAFVHLAGEGHLAQGLKALALPAGFIMIVFLPYIIWSFRLGVAVGCYHKAACSST
jgi:hypothetical protein